MLARYKLVSWVVVVTSAGGAVTAWVEFADLARKIERYTTAVRSLDKLLTWWVSLGEVEKASTMTISRLISTGESIISEERLAWVSTNISDEQLPRSDEGGAEGSGKGGTAKRSAHVHPMDA